MIPPVLSLLELQPGETGIVETIDALDFKKALILQAYGLMPGVPLTFLRASPLGDLLSFTLRGTCIALRREVAACIQVRL